MNSILTALSHGVLTAAELRRRLDVSPPTLMRAVRATPEVLRIGNGRATRYARRQTWPLLDGPDFPVIRITRDGSAEPAGRLLTLAARETIWLPEGVVSTGLPPAIGDLRPSGFLGRSFAALHADLRLPERLNDWSDHHILLAMSRRGEDLPGNLIVGEESFVRWQSLGVPARTRDDYPALAAETIAGRPPGSSAGGERPKFGALADGRHVLVKFAARSHAGDAVAARWCDLLVLEAIASEVIAARGIGSVEAHLVQCDTHVFLESARFDRIGQRGRVGVMSLAAVHDNLADSWARAAVQLHEAGRIDGDTARRIRWLDAFGALIGNTDRHQYNIVFFHERDTLTLAPVFDQTPMRYAPTPDAQALSPALAAPLVSSDTLDVWDDAREAACGFWEQASGDDRLSDGMRRLCAANLRAIR